MSLLEGQESEEEVEPSRPLNYPRLVAANLCLRLLPQTSIFGLLSFVKITKLVPLRYVKLRGITIFHGKEEKFSKEIYSFKVTRESSRKN